MEVDAGKNNWIELVVNPSSSTLNELLMNKIHEFKKTGEITYENNGMELNISSISFITTSIKVTS